MAAATETRAQSSPEVTVLKRVASIPMIHSSFGSLHDTITKNAYTRSLYMTAEELSLSAYKYTEPLQVRLAPIIQRADSFANKAVDAVESRYPYPFKAKPEEVADFVRKRRASASSYVSDRVHNANKVIDEKVKSPAFHVAQEIDHRFAPIVDYFEVAVSRIHPNESGRSSPHNDTKYQYQRAIALTHTLRENIYESSNEQFKQLQAQSVLVQKATETAQAISSIASSSLTSVQTRIHTLSDKMLSELQKLQASTASLSAYLQDSAVATIHNSSSQIQSQIPPRVQQSYAEFSSGLASAVTEMKNIISTKDMTLQDKVTRVGHEVRERVTPLLDGLRWGVMDIFARGKQAAAAGQSKATANGGSERSD